MGHDVECALCGCSYREHGEHECDRDAVYDHAQKKVVREIIQLLSDMAPGMSAYDAALDIEDTYFPHLRPAAATPDSSENPGDQ